MASMGEPVAERIVQAVADSTDDDALELPPLYDTIDPEALDALVTRISDGEVSFNYAGQRVTVQSDGTVVVEGQLSDSTVSR